MKKILLLCSCFALLTACSNSSSSEITKNAEITTKTSETIETTTPEFIETTKDEEIEIIFSILSMSEDENAEQFVEEYNKNNNANYYVYDDTHYAGKLKQSEIDEFLKSIDSNKAFEESITSLNQSYSDVFTKITFDKETCELKIYANNEKYQSADFGVGIAAFYTGVTLTDFIQAYMQIPLDERNYNIEILDDITNEVIYSPE